jgi:hypothetical protein
VDEKVTATASRRPVRRRRRDEVFMMVVVVLGLFPFPGVDGDRHPVPADVQKNSPLFS